MKKLAVKQGRYICRDGIWYVGYDVVALNGDKIKSNEAHVVERGYVCRDGVWFRRVAAEAV